MHYDVNIILGCNGNITKVLYICMFKWS